MTITEARQLLAYDSWATGRVLAAVEELPAELLEATVASSFASVRETLGHIVGAQWIWLRRWSGESPSARPAWSTGASLDELRRQLASVEAECGALVAGLADADLERIVVYRLLSGLEASNRLADLIRHVVNHSSYHRGQIATQLRQLGETPPGTDFITFLRPA